MRVMRLLPIRTKRLAVGDDLIAALLESGAAFRDGDILVLSSKIVATCEGRVTNLAAMKISNEAERYAKLCGRSSAFCQAVLEETSFRRGNVVGTCPGAMVTEVRPATGVILTANAGMDESNAPAGTAIGWPEDPVQSARVIRSAMMRHFDQLLVVSFWLLVRQKIRRYLFRKLTTNNYKLKTHRFAVIITDTCVRPRRWGVVAFALACAGMDPFKDEAGHEDLFGRKLRVTREAVADQLATAANCLMGNAAQSVPAVIIRDHGISMTDFVGWVPGIDPEEDLFKGIL